MGATSRQIDDALVYSDDLARLRKLPNASDDAIAATAQRLDAETSLPQRVQQVVDDLDRAAAAAEVVDLACTAYDVAGWDSMSADEKAAFVRSQRPGLGGDAYGYASAVDEAGTALRTGDDVAAFLARATVCSAASAASAYE